MKRDLFRPLLPPLGDLERIDYVNDKTIGLHKREYFDYTASGLAFELIEERIHEVLLTYANTHSKEASMAELTGSYYDRARENLVKMLGLGDEFAVIPSGCGATRAIKRFQEIMGLYIPPATINRYGITIDPDKRPLVIVGPYEHHSNEISYREALCETVRIGLNAKGLVDLDQLAAVLKANAGREIIGAFCIASNVSGIITPYEEISRLLRAHDAVVCFDAAASSPYLNIPSELYDAMFMSPHKLLGGPGSCGILVIRRSLVDETAPPTFAGGGTVEYVSRTSHTFDGNVERREDAGTPGILQLIRAALAYQLRNEIGFELIKSRKQKLMDYFIDELSSISGATIYGNRHAPNIGIVSFNIEGYNPYELCSQLSQEFGVQTRAGCSCAGPYGHDLLQLGDNGLEDNEKPGWLRISIHFSQQKSDILHLIECLKESIALLSKKQANG